LTKSIIRSKIRAKLKAQKERDRSRKSKLIKDALFSTSVFKKAKRVMFYITFGGEVNTVEMIKEAQKLGKIIVVPVCKKNRIIKACLLGKDTKLARGPYGIWEPVVQECVNLKRLDLVVIPGVAFDREGNRLGRGKGYYDRFLKKLSKRTASIGLAFDFQILPFVPAKVHDVSVNKVLFA
jgi:5-formyltetrahydrofolate cyclo-ligase